MIKIGPAGIGGIKEIETNFEFLNKNNIKAAEIAFTYGIYIKKEQATKIKQLAQKFNISLSIHAPYYINLNSKDKLEASKKRILDSCEIGNSLGVKNIVFHAGFYGKDSKEETYKFIKEQIIELQKIIKENNWDVLLTPETTGKINVFGSLDEILRLVQETNCSFCIDFAHLKAREQENYNIKEIVNKIKHFKHLHCHFSGINYTEKGERNHIPIDIQEFKEILDELKKNNLDCTIICEAPDTYNDAIKMQKEI
ncbi:TIM barrel protein [Candidatus Woesearchaeota archaeon]|nr:TIM barrel protein [Candidatus Woesearchaeota archaeon]